MGGRTEKLVKHEGIMIIALLAGIATISIIYVLVLFDANAKCYGQKLSGVPKEKTYQITEETIDGMDNVDISYLFNAWFRINICLALISIMIKLFNMLFSQANLKKCFSCT